MDYFFFGELISNIDTIDVLCKALLDIMDNICNVDNSDNVMLTLHLQREPKNPARIHFNGAARNYGSLLCTKAVALFSLLSYPKDSERPSWSDFQAEQRQKKKI